jgi:hypothetical protein
MAKNRNYDLAAATTFLTAVEDALRSRPWFKANGWLCSVHDFPPPPAIPESVTLHVFKGTWLNEDRRGVHFETNLSPKEWRGQSMPVVLHILHHPLIPGTKLKRIKLSTPFIDNVGELIGSWPGYKFRAGKYGTQPFNHDVNIDLQKENESALLIADQFEMLCLQLGPAMDEALRITHLVEKKLQRPIESLQTRRALKPRP